MIKVLLCSGLGVVVGSVVAGIIQFHGVEDAFGFAQVDPNIVEIEQSEFDLLYYVTIGGVAGMWLFGTAGWLMTHKARLRAMAQERPELFTVEALVSLGVHNG